MKDETLEQIVNCDDVRQVRMLQTRIGTLRGLWKFAAEPFREQMSQRARGYYFGVVCKSLVQYVRDQGDPMNTDQAHEFFKAKFIPPLQFTNKKTGELETYPPTTTKFDTVEGAEYIDKCIVYLAEMGVVVPDPTFDRSGLKPNAAA